MDNEDFGPIYQPLDKTRQEIRVLQIISTSPNIVCKLQIVALRDDPAFSALSYVWGDPSITEEITINGEPMPVSVNLACTLRDIHQYWNDAASIEESTKTTHWLWVDAISINQKHIEEKNHQVPLMGALYYKAKVVLSYLGPFESNLSEIFDLYTLLGHEVATMSESDKGSLEWLKKYPELCNPPNINRAIFSRIGELFLMPYWTRLWICQEVALAQKAILFCGSKALDFETVDTVSRHFTETRSIPGRALKPDFVNQRLFMSHINFDPGVLHFIGKAKDVSRKAQWEGGVLRRNPMFWPLYVLSFILNGAHRYKATNPKDHIYGFTGITDIHFNPDYSENKTVADVYCDFFSIWVTIPFHEMPDMYNAVTSILAPFDCAGIGYPWSRIPGLPSWAPNFAGLANAEGNDKSRITGVHTQRKADKGVFPDDLGPPRLDGWTLSCHGIQLGCLENIQPKFASHDKDLVDGKVDNSDNQATGDPTWLWIHECVQKCALYPPGNLSTFAACIEAIYPAQSAETEDSTLGIFCSSFLQYQKHLKSLSIDASEVLQVEFEILMEGNQVFSFKSPLTGYMPREGSAKERGATFWRNLKRALDQLTKYVEANNDVIDRVGHGTEGLRFGRTSNGLIGLFPPGVLPDDTLWILKGCRAPVVLRKSGDHYELVGLCYIVGLMKGEAVAMIQHGLTTIEKIALR